MAWEMRGGRRYYYRKKRIGSKVISKYVGVGPVAEAACSADSETLKKRSEEKKQRDEAKRIEAMTDGIIQEITMVAGGMLIASGYHQHHGEWRKQR